MKPRLLLLSEGERKPARDVLSGCSLPCDELEGTPTPRPLGVHRGVFRDPFPPDGQAAYVLVDISGARRRRIEMPVADVTDETLPELYDLLDGLDPPGPRRA